MWPRSQNAESQACFARAAVAVGLTGCFVEHHGLTTTEMMSQLLKRHPIFPTKHSPAYTNVVYAFLGFAQEAITGTPFSEALTKNVLSITTWSTRILASPSSWLPKVKCLVSLI
jgi:hypothetical protein